MSVPPLQRPARVACWGLAFFVIVASLVPGDVRQLSPFPGLLEHFAAYLAFDLALELGYGSYFPPRTFAYLLITAASVLETVQVFIPGRHAAFLDFVASAAGALAGVEVAMLIIRWSARGETRV